MDNIIHLENKEANVIAEGRNSLICYQEESEFKTPVVFKVIREERNFHPYTTQILNEYELLNSLDIIGVRKAFGKTNVNGGPAVMLEYINGLTLKAYIEQSAPPFIKRLELAISICKIIVKIHQQDIIHKDINPHNILVNQKQEVFLIDFGLATKLNTKSDVQNVANYVAGTLAYISPEQTGRVNHVVDQRSDLYALGVVLYELFSAELPFTTQDPMELVHAHLAVQPIPLINVNPEVPQVISQIVLKLLSKNLESRYQTAAGLLADLLDCYNQMELKVKIKPFEIGRKDRSDKFLTPSKLYGRDHEINALLLSIGQIGAHKEITLITGDSGTGKTSLIYEVYKPLTQKNGYFIHGKFEQLQKDIPYHALVQALSYLINQILSESEEQLKEWKAILKVALGSEGKLLTDLIPNLELIVGEQEPLVNLGINEAQNRFDYIFLKFIKAIATADHPLILFIDDMQWANSSSLHLLKKIVLNEEINQFYFIGAYRDNEVDDAHPTQLAVSELKGTVKVNEIKLRELFQVHVTELICETFLMEQEQGELLAKVVHDKTAGNPFFVNQFLQSIYENKLIAFQTGDSQSSWVIDLAGMEKMNFTDNVVEFMIRRIEKLNENEKYILRLGSCIGDVFDLATLSSISIKASEVVEKCLYQLVKDQFITLLDENPDEYVQFQNRGNKNRSISNTYYKFPHDRFRQAAYAMLPKEQKAGLHLRIAEHMVNNMNPEKQMDHIFNIVFHLNNCPDGMLSTDMKRKSITLNHKAAIKAKSSSAYQNALFLYERGIELLRTSKKAIDHELYMQLLTGAMECAYLIGAYAKMENLADQIFKQANTVYEKVDAYRVTIYSLIARNRYQEATNLGIDVLKHFNVHFPLHPTKFQIVTSLLKTKILIGKKGATHFSKLPPIEDRKALATLDIINSFASAAYHVTPELFPLVIMKMLRISLKYGSTTNLISTYAAYGIILCGVTGEMNEGYSYGVESIKMLKSFPDANQAKARTKLIFTTFISHWKDHLHKSLPLLLESYQDGLESGDQEFAAGSIFVHSYHSFLLGVSLPESLTRLKDFHHKIEQLNQKSYELYSAIDLQAFVNLSGNSENPAALKGEYFNEDDFLENKDHQERRDDMTARFHFHFFKMTAHYLSNDYEEAFLHSEKLRKLEVAMSTPFIPHHVFYDSLIGLALCWNSSASSLRKKWAKRISGNQKKLSKWMNHAPMNFSHKYLLVAASVQYVFKRNKEQAQTLFKKSILEATQHGYISDLAVANELAGDFYNAIGEVNEKLTHYAKAYSNYKNWGIAIKLKQLQRFAGAQEKQSAVGTITTTYTDINGDLSMVDLSTIIKASSAISSEIKLKKLIHQLLKIVTQNAGAQSGVFILHADDEMQVQATMNEHGEIEDAAKKQDLAGYFYSDRIIQFVKRTERALIIDDAQNDERFLDDAYVKANHCRSMLCFPIINKKRIIGLIQLENNLTTSVFNVRRMEILKLLSGQMAVSLENAMLYDKMEQKVEERTHELEQQRNELRNKNVELTDLNREKDDLINVVSHDLRSPLNQMKGLAGLLKVESKDPIVTEYSDKMIEATDRLNNMIIRILDISSLEAQKIELRLEHFDVIALTSQVIDSFLHTAKGKNIELSLITSQEEGMIELDKNFYIQIMENLLSNAIKFSPINSKVKVHIVYAEHGFEVEVQDNGPGIDESDQKMLFNKFQKLSAKPTAGEKSIGLGLSIVKRYVDAMGGKVWCESEVDKGASFYLAFPIAK